MNNTQATKVLINKYPFINVGKKREIQKPTLKISRDDKGRASSVERDDRSRNSLSGEESKRIENHPTTTSNDEGVIKAKKKASAIRRGRSIESLKKEDFKHKTFKI